MSDADPLILSTHELHVQASARLEAVGELRIASSPEPDVLMEEGREAAIVIVRAPLPAALFAQAPALRAAIRHGAGLDMIPVEAATAAGVLVANVPGVNASSVAESVLLGILRLLKQSRVIERTLRDEGWWAGRRQADTLHDLGGRTVGLVGFGNVGRQIFKIAHDGFGLDVLVHTRTARDLPRGASGVALDALMAESDIVVLCCPLTDETHGLIDARRIALMKRDALLINVARGAVTDEAALLTALQGGRIAGAYLDVFTEQPLPGDHPFHSLENVLITPHIAGITEESMMRMGVGAAREAVRVLEGGLPVNLCNPQVVEAYRRRFG